MPNNMFKGKLQPFTPRRHSIPIWEAKEIAGKRKYDKQEFFSIVRFWIYSPTADFPKISVNFGISNGAGSAFTNLNADEVKQLFAWLLDCKDQIEARLPELNAKAIQLQQEQEQTYKMMEMVRQAQKLQAVTDVNDEPPPDYDIPENTF